MYQCKKHNTAESQRLKIYVQNVHHSCENMHSNNYATAQLLLLRWCSSAAFTCSADVLSTPSYHGSANGRPSLEGYPDAVVHRIQIWRIGWPHLWRDKLLASLSAAHDSVTCTMNGMISVTSTLRYQVRDVHGTQRSKFTSMMSIHLQSCVPKIIKKIRTYW